MHYKYMIVGIVLIAGLVFGLLFWEDFKQNQQELAETPLSLDSGENMTQTVPAGDTARCSGDNVRCAADTETAESTDDYDSMESDLNDTDLNSMDSGNSELQTEASNL